MKVSKIIDISKQYKFPQVKIVNYDSMFLIIAVQEANWLVLTSQEELDIFNELSSKTINEVMEIMPHSLSTITRVVTQIEAKHFCQRKPLLKVDTWKKLHLYLTNACNLRCPHCYMFSGEAYSNELSFNEICLLIDSFTSSGGYELTLSGGEISLRRDLLEIVKYAHLQGLFIKLLTNGTLWSYENVRKIAPFVSKVQISIDGYNEEENRKIRGCGNFAISMEAVEYFIDCGVPVDIAITPMFDSNLESKIDQYASFGKNILEKYGNSKVGIIFNGEIIDGRSFSLNESQKKKYSQLIERIYFKCYGYGNKEAFFSTFKDGYLFNNCSYGNLTVAANGDVYFCPQITSICKVANIRNDSWRDIENLLDNAKSRADVENLNPCRYCELKYICGGGCRYKYFQDFRTNDFIHHDKFAKRNCSIEYKNYFYRLMVQTNSMFYSE